MDLIQVLILSLVEGLTEFLPISSTGHLILTSNLLKIPQTDFVKSFEVIIQLGAILAVVFLYWKKILNSKTLWKKILIAFLPAAVVGYFLYRVIKDVFLGNPVITLWALFLGGILLIVFEVLWKQKDRKLDNIEDISNKNALLIGIAQSVSVIPGVSRAGATIVGGLLTGLSRKAAVEFSFLLAIPTMFAATILDLKESAFNFSSQEFLLLGIGFAGAFITALIAVKFFIKYVQNHTFIPFGVYRIVLSVLYWLIILN